MTGNLVGMIGVVCKVEADKKIEIEPTKRRYYAARRTRLRRFLLLSNSGEAPARDAKRIRAYYSFFFSGSTFGKSCLFSLNVPVKALTNALRKTLKIVVMTAAFGSSKLPLKGTLVPNLSLG
jgi:hypothetical protein